MPKQPWVADIWMVLVIGVAAVLRLSHLGTIPSCLEYDEACILIVAGEIAQGKSFPVFIRPYTGQEALFFYLAAGTMKLAGMTPFALRLAAVTCGLLSVALTYFCARQLFRDGCSDGREGRWASLFSAALVAVSYWQVNLSRFGYRAVSLPPLLGWTIGSLMRAVHTGQRRSAVVAGIAAGLSAYTYSAVRALPVVLLVVWVWVLISDRRRWQIRIGQLALYGLVAAMVFAPLGLFFLRHPGAFSGRLEQVSLFSPAVNEGDLWGTLGRTLRLALGMFTVSGDLNPLYNYPGKPVFDRILGPFFYLGLLICIWRMVRPPYREGQSPGTSRLPYVLLVVWIVVMMAPNVLSASGVPHNLRAMAFVPAVFVVPALGLVVPVWHVEEWLGRVGENKPRSPRTGALRLVGTGWKGVLFPGALAALLACEGCSTYRDYLAWAKSAPPYYKGNEALVSAARLIDAHPEADPYVGTYFQQHATLAVYSDRYQAIRWLGKDTLVLPPPGAAPALLIYDHTTPPDPVLRQRFLPDSLLFQREFGPDGGVGFEAYWLDQAHRPVPAPQYPMRVNMGHTLAFLGYDLNAPARAGQVLDVTLYLQVSQRVDRNDYALFAHLVDDLGFHWAGDTFFDYPSGQWRPGEVLIMRRQFPVAPGAPPGEYTLDLGSFSASLDARLPVLDEAGRMTGTVVRVGPIRVERALEAPARLPAIQRPHRESLGDVLTFLGSDRDRGDLRPGEVLALTLYWQSTQAIDQRYVVSLWLSGARGNIPLWHGDPVHGWYGFSHWQPGEFVRDRYALRLPLDTPAQDHDLRMAVVDEEGTPLRIGGGAATWLSLGTVHVHATDRLWEPPPGIRPLGIRLGAAVELLGYDVQDNKIHPGDTLHLTLVWRCHDAIDTEYTVFTHLLDRAEQVWGQKDNPPVGGSYPTTLWVPGEVVVDPYEIPVSADAVAGEYAIEVGMYDPRTMRRLSVMEPTGSIGDRVLLAQVQIEDRP